MVLMQKGRVFSFEFKQKGLFPLFAPINGRPQVAPTYCFHSCRGWLCRPIFRVLIHNSQFKIQNWPLGLIDIIKRRFLLLQFPFAD